MASTTTSKIFVIVVGGLILSGLLYVAHLIPTAFHWVLSAFMAGLHWFTASHAIPGWLLGLLSICGIWCIFRIAAAFMAAPIPDEPQWEDFTEFEFLGLLWRWCYDPRGNLDRLFSFCPQSGCDMQVYGKRGQYYGPFNESTIYRCHRCGHTKEAQGSQSQVENKVTLEVQRLLRCGDWKKHISVSE